MQPVLRGVVKGALGCSRVMILLSDGVKDTHAVVEDGSGVELGDGAEDGHAVDVGVEDPVFVDQVFADVEENPGAYGRVVEELGDEGFEDLALCGVGGDGFAAGARDRGGDDYMQGKVRFGLDTDREKCRESAGVTIYAPGEVAEVEDALDGLLVVAGMVGLDGGVAEKDGKGAGGVEVAKGPLRILNTARLTRKGKRWGISLNRLLGGGVPFVAEGDVFGSELREGWR